MPKLEGGFSGGFFLKAEKGLARPFDTLVSLC